MAEVWLPTIDIDVSTLVELEPFQRLAATRMMDEIRILADNNENNGNVEAWQPWALNQKAFVDVSSIDTSTTVLGHRIELPVMVAPFSVQAFCHPDAELATAEGARRAGTMMALSLATSRSPAEVGAVSGPFWMHQQFIEDRELMLDIITEAKEGGATAVALTVDLPITMWWPAAERAAMLAISAHWPGYFTDRFAAATERLAREGARVRRDDWSWDNRPIGSSATWADFEWLRDASPLPIVLKGILNAEDARLAVEHGAAGIIVSNHGGHGLAQARPTAEALPEIVEAVDGRIEVLVDGGIRDAADVYRAVAMGARAVLIGRRALWGLVLGGADGVARVLQLFHDELEVLMGMTGARTVAEIDRSRIVRRYSRW
jgi:4-hydroxymandelate oxidase